MYKYINKDNTMVSDGNDRSIPVGHRFFEQEVKPWIDEGNEIAPFKSAEDMMTLEERAEALKQEALAYQSAQQSQNELGILHGYSVEELASKPIAQAQIDWMTSLFALQKAKELDESNDTPFSSVGDKPHSFTEIYDEKFGL